MNRPSQGSAGFSLVEVALSLAILAVGMTGVLALLPVGLDSARQVHAETIAASLVRSAMGNFSSNGWTASAYSAISGPAQGTVLTNQYYSVDGQLVAKPTNAVFVLQFVKGTSDNNSCRVFVNLAWPYAAWLANSNSPLIQRRSFVMDVLRN